MNKKRQYKTIRINSKEGKWAALRVNGKTCAEPCVDTCYFCDNKSIGKNITCWMNEIMGVQAGIQIRFQLCQSCWDMFEESQKKYLLAQVESLALERLDKEGVAY